MSDSFYTNACIKLGKNNFKKNKSQKEKVWKLIQTFFYPHTSSAISLTNFTLAHCCSSVNLFPISHEAKPHCGLRHKFSKGTYWLASLIRAITVSLSSNLADFVVTKPSTTFFIGCNLF